MTKTNNDYDKLGDKLLSEISSIDRSELFWKLSAFYSDDESHAKRIFTYLENKYWCPSTPVIANLPENGKAFKGLPISCFLNEVIDGNTDKIITETMALSKSGGGLGTDWTAMSSSYEKTNKESRNFFGVIPFVQSQGKIMRLTAGSARKVGSLCVYLSINHADILNFLRMRKTAQGIDAELLIPRYIHHAITITDEFMNCVLNNQDWFLYDRNENIVNKVKARDLWMEILSVRTETGEPYLFFVDSANRATSEENKKLGLKIKLSNLCTEIILPTGKDHLGLDRTAICCLSSVNLLHYDKFNYQFFEDIARFMDNVLTFFIVEGERRQVGEIVNYEKQFGLCHDLRPLEEEAVKRAFTFNHPLRGAIYSAFRARDIGIGCAGLHTMYLSKMIPFESEEASKLNKECFDFMHEMLQKASKVLAIERGPSKDAGECGLLKRFGHMQAIAPTTQISAFMGVSRCIEADEPVFLNKNQAGFHVIKNPFLSDYLETKDLNNHETWMKIASDGLETIVNKDIYEVFKGPFDINPLTKLYQAKDRKICQSQSFNLFFKTPIDMNLLIKTHLEAWRNQLKTMYYLRSTEGQKVSAAVNFPIEESNQNQCSLDNAECLMCQ